MSAPFGYAMFAIAALLYGVAAVLFYAEVISVGQRRRERSKTPPRVLAGAVAAHGSYVVHASFVAQVCPIHSVHFMLSVASLLATGVYLGARLRFQIHALGLVVAPTGLVVTLGTFFMGRAQAGQRWPASFIGLHVLSNLLGEALFLLACGAAVMYLIQERRLKNKKILPSGGLPPLDSLDRAAHRFLVAGFPLITVGLATGTVWAQQLESGTPDEILRAVFGYAAWLLIAAVLLLRVLAGWTGRRAAYGTVAGFVCAVMVLVIYLVRPLLRDGPMVGG
ncbi:MAG: cytochrome c biogenesis protein CcsA [Deltaproteobacteria bacterium]|nr:cytochrome c biogenesis protein CcsA [Deltaproteobacteria bacterium]